MTRMYNALRELTLARMREFYREPEVIFWVYIFPILLIVGLGIAFREGGETKIRVRVSAAPTDQSALEWVVAALDDEPAIRVVTVPLAEARDVDSRNPADLVVVVAGTSTSPRLHYVFDHSQAASRSAHRRTDGILQKKAGRQDTIPTTVEGLDHTGSRYIDWLVPGLLGMNIMGGGLWGVGFVCVDLRMRKLLKRFVATPMRRSHFLLSLMGSRMIFLVPEMAIILVVAYLLFGVEVRGDVLSLAVVILLSSASFAGLGLLVACRAQKIETISGLLNVVMMPMWILSGVFFSPERFPQIMQPFVQALPLTQVNNVLRAVMLDAAPLSSQWLSLAVLALWGGLSFPAALRCFRWQ